MAVSGFPNQVIWKFLLTHPREVEEVEPEEEVDLVKGGDHPAESRKNGYLLTMRKEIRLIFGKI